MIETKQSTYQNQLPPLLQNIGQPNCPANASHEISYCSLIVIVIPAVSTLLYCFDFFRMVEYKTFETSPKSMPLVPHTDIARLGFLQPSPTITCSITAKKPMQIPQLSDIEIESLRYSRFEKIDFIMLPQPYLFVVLNARAALLGGCSGFSLIKITKRMKGTVVIMASNLRKSMISMAVLLGWTNIPGMVSPTAIETRLTSTPINVTQGTDQDLNQLIANLLGVFRMKIPPTADSNDPNRQIYEFPTVKKVLSHIPAITRSAAMQKLTLIPFVLSSQLQGSAKMVCAMGYMRVLSETSTMLRSNRFQTVEFRAAKVLTGRELTNAASTQVRKITNRYLCYSIRGESIAINNLLISLMTFQ